MAPSKFVHEESEYALVFACVTAISVARAFA